MHRLSLLTATALVALPLAAHAEATFDFDKTPGRLPKTVVPDYYKIDLIPDVAKLTLAGHETIHLTVKAATDSFTLNQIGLTLTSARLEDGTAASVTANDKTQLATLTFPKQIATGAHTLTIDYTGAIPNNPAGLYYDDYKTPAGQKARMLVTQFESTDARRMFPGWDEPAFKARFELSVVVPKNFAAIGNMPVTVTSAVGADLKKVQFAPSPRMSTYLLAMVAGDMKAVRDHAGGANLAVWAPTGEEDEGKYALSVEKNVLPFYNNYFGTNYPLPKLDMIAIPGNFDAGAMENWGAITYTDEGLLFDDKTSNAATRERIHIYVAHEMAHQWSGDLVTMAWWNNIWLNEGFASWMENKATDHFNPEWQIWPRQHASREGAMGGDAHPTTHPIQQTVNDESEAAALFDQISYQKGELVIRMIEDWLTPEKFRDGMRLYMKAHAYNNTTSADLWAALSKASGRNVAEVASSFTEQPGFPVVTVTRACTGKTATVTLAQQRFTVNDPHPAPLSWTIPVTLGAPGAKETRVLLATTPVTVPLASCTAAIKANIGEAGYYRTQYDAASLKAVEADFTKFAPADRANLLGDQYAMFVANRADLTTWLDMLPALGTETTNAVWDEVLGRLDRIDVITRATPTHAAWRAYARKLLAPEFARLGWDAKPGESFLNSELRPKVILNLGLADDPEIIAEAQKRFAAFLVKPDSLAPNLREPVFQIIGHHADAATYDKLRALGEAAISSEEKLRYFTAMAMSPDPALVARTVDYLTTGKVPNGRLVQVLFAASNGSENPELVFKLVREKQDKIRSFMAGFSPTYLLPAATVSSTNPDTAKALLADPASNSSNGAKAIAAQVADGIMTAADLRTRGLPALDAWLKTH